MSYKYTTSLAALDPGSFAHRELYGRHGGRGAVRRALQNPCSEIEGGKRFAQMDWMDADLYRRAGCVDLGTQAVRAGVEWGEGAGPIGARMVRDYTDVWCCNPESVEQVFQEWTESDQYQSRRRTIGVIIVAGVLGALALVIWNYKKRVQAGEDVGFLGAKTTGVYGVV
jgi:hypothetical protein